jgi:hypothetical protein
VESQLSRELMHSTLSLVPFETKETGPGGLSEKLRREKEDGGRGTPTLNVHQTQS